MSSRSPESESCVTSSPREVHKSIITAAVGGIPAIEFNNAKPLVLIAGLNVLESKALAFEVAEQLQTICSALNIPFVFKASFDKANRSSIDSFRGPGFAQGIDILGQVKEAFKVPILTDIHETHQAAPAAEVVDVLQLPAFLCRQTDLVKALAQTSAVINIKKAQFLAPQDLRHIITKFEAYGNDRLLVCERGTCFGYHNLVVDMLGFELLKSLSYPVVFDVTHALQQPTANGQSAGGRRAQVLQLARAGVSQKIAALFLETHPDPEQAKCDGPCALRLHQLKPFLEQIQTLDALVKSFPDIETA